MENNFTEDQYKAMLQDQEAEQRRRETSESGHGITPPARTTTNRWSDFSDAEIALLSTALHGGGSGKTAWPGRKPTEACCEDLRLELEYEIDTRKGSHVRR